MRAELTTQCLRTAVALVRRRWGNGGSLDVDIDPNQYALRSRWVREATKLHSGDGNTVRDDGYQCGDGGDAHHRHHASVPPMLTTPLSGLARRLCVHNIPVAAKPDRQETLAI